MSSSGQEYEFGPFGSGKPLGKRRWSFWFFLKSIGVLSTLIGLGTLGFYARSLYLEFGERDPAEIKLSNPPLGLGLSPAAVTLELKDEGAGVDRVIVRVEQGRQSQQLLLKDYKGRVLEDKIVIPLDAKARGFHEGTVTLSVVAFDKSFWSNSSKATLQLEVDFRKPRISLITTQHNAVRGGVELAFYRLLDDPKAESGVAVGDSFFPGFPARRLDSAFESVPDVYFAFFGIPFDFKDEIDALRVIAKDAVGNSATASMFYRVAELKRGEKTDVIPSGFLEKKIEALYREYLKTETRIRGSTEKEYIPAVTREERVERFKAVNEDYRTLINEETLRLFSHPKIERFWEGRFFRPPGKSSGFELGDRRHFTADGQEMGFAVQLESDLLVPSGTEVRATNSGSVIFADTLGIYGKTVIIDHGFGLSTVYAHLSSIEQTEGTRVGQGQVIAHSGDSGFAFQPEIGFSVRLNGVPVRPAEWWDERWIADHITSKIVSVKSNLGLEVREVLP